MKLKDIEGVERYLQEGCYCPGEIYSFDGFFYMMFDGESTCKEVASSDDKIVVVTQSYDYSKNSDSTDPKCVQIVVFYRDESGKVVDALRMDATENNFDLIRKYVDGTISENERHKFDEYDKGSTQSSVRKVLNLCDAVIVD